MAQQQGSFGGLRNGWKEMARDSDCGQIVGGVRKGWREESKGKKLQLCFVVDSEAKTIDKTIE